MKLSEALKKAQEWVGTLSEKAAEAEADSKAAQELAVEKTNDMIAAVRGELAATQENLRMLSEAGKSKTNAELIKTKMSIDAAKDQFDAFIAEKKEASDKLAQEEYILGLTEYYQNCEALAAYLTKEAELAKLETMSACQQYTERFGPISSDDPEQ